jgi:hypothetical protein
METNLCEAQSTLEIRDEDIRAIRRSKNPNWVLRGIIALSAAVVSFLSGYVVGSATEPGVSNYPYGAAVLASAAAGQRKRIPVLFVAILAALSLLSFFFGYATGDKPALGIVTYYGSYSPKD